MDANIQQQLITEGIKILEITFTIGGAIYTINKTKLKAYLDKKADLIDNEKLRTLAKDTIDVIDKLVTNEVTNADITLKPAIIQAISDGKVTIDELTSLKGVVKDKVLKQLTNDSKEAVSTTIANLDTYLDSTVETILGQLKLDLSSPVSKTIIPEKTKVETANVIESADNITTSQENTNSGLPNETPDNPEVISNDTSQIIDSNVTIPQ